MQIMEIEWRRDLADIHLDLCQCGGFYVHGSCPSCGDQGGKGRDSVLDTWVMTRLEPR